MIVVGGGSDIFVRRSSSKAVRDANRGQNLMCRNFTPPLIYFPQLIAVSKPCLLSTLFRILEFDSCKSNNKDILPYPPVEIQSTRSYSAVLFFSDILLMISLGGSLLAL